MSDEPVLAQEAQLDVGGHADRHRVAVQIALKVLAGEEGGVLLECNDQLGHVDLHRV